MGIGKTWDKEVCDTEEEIKSMAGKTAEQIEMLFKSKNGGWRRVAGGWEKRVAKLLKGAPVLECDGGEYGDS